MHIKPVIFVVISALLVAAIYSLSTFVVFAKDTTTMKTTVLKTKYSTTYCTGDSKHTLCDVYGTDGKLELSMSCDKQKNGTWKCVQDESTVGNVSPGLRQELIKAQAGVKTGGSNNTTVLQDGLTKNPRVQ